MDQDKITWCAKSVAQQFGPGLPPCQNAVIFPRMSQRTDSTEVSTNNPTLLHLQHQISVGIFSLQLNSPSVLKISVICKKNIVMHAQMELHKTMFKQQGASAFQNRISDETSRKLRIFP